MYKFHNTFVTNKYRMKPKLLLRIAAVARLLCAISGSRDGSATKVMWATGTAIVLLAVDEIIYFFPLATAFCVVSANLVSLSIFLIRKTTDQITYPKI